jgi:hypothetical protein
MTPAWALVILAFLITAPLWIPILTLIIGVIAAAVALAFIFLVDVINHLRERAHIWNRNRNTP